MQTIPNIILIVLIALSHDANELSGQWNGALNVQGKVLTIIFHIKTSGSGYEATFDGPDQNVKDVPVSKVTYDFPNVTLESDNIGMIFEGQIRGDQIIGTWKQSGMTFDLTLVRDKSATDK